MARRWLLLPIVFVVCLTPSTATAQSILDRVVRTDKDRPLIITELKGETVGRLSGAAGVPMGFEAAPLAPVRTWAIAATGKTLREVADAIVAADPRYDWREDNGVLVFRQRAAWEGGRALDALIAGLTLDDVEAADALRVIGRLFGATNASTGFGDTHRFSVDVPAGSTRLAALNAIVRAHGTLAWAVERTSGRAVSEDFAFSVFLFVGGEGTGVGIPRAAPVPSSLSSEDVTSRTRAARGDQVPLLDRIVGPNRIGGRASLRVYGISGRSLAELAAAAGVPIGIQTLSPALPRVAYPAFEGYVMTGMPLRAALDLLASLDARYEWREMNGVVVFRPVLAWNDPNDPLFRLAPNVELHDEPTPNVIGVVLSVLGRPEPNPNFPDTRALSVDVPQGSVLELLNAVVRAHGEVSWEWAELGAADRQARGGLRHSLTLTVFSGVGFGWMLP